MTFDYYYGSQADQFSFIRIPRILLTEEMFSSLTLQSKMLYSILLDRMSISMKNGWFDEENRAYIIYQISEIQDDLGFSKKKAMNYLAELEKFGLVEKKKRGFGLPSIIYVKSFLIRNDGARGVNTGTSDEKSIGDRGVENGISGVLKSHSGSAENDTSEVPESIPLEVTKPIPLRSNNNTNYTNLSYNHSNHISSVSGSDEDEMRKLKAYSEMISENLELKYLKQNHRFDEDLIDGIFDLILEVVMSKSPTTVIASNEYPTELVKSRFLKLNSSHIEYAIDCFNQNSTKVRNIKKYLLAILFNAPSTISGYYTAEVHHDMPYLAAK
ncbi:DUF6017 domain-containing protein [Fusibacillus kribbianus]|uniref:DUF6017 domain-containing protein n=1 Tax=Fusibacillus kribbianus TaxID=3044208 RepID=A0AAP4EXP2_9FIRM|nr:DUF6017 domain-containing protein [Ruminococcus sp. YH-rum2234]MDI9242739.1 DUF6017 domain-containing protein [Ruminococcus sp. YH-rum2234]